MVGDVCGWCEPRGQTWKVRLSAPIIVGSSPALDGGGVGGGVDGGGVGGRGVDGCGIIGGAGSSRTVPPSL